MDQGSSRSRANNGTLPRLSRLPKIVPRASHDGLNLSRDGHTEDPVKSSQLPRPSRPNASRVVPPTPLGENVNRSVRDRYGWSAAGHSGSRRHSPVRDALQAIRSAALDTTPPSSGSGMAVFEDGDENPQSEQEFSKPAEFSLGRRRPRPSLTERTVETLASISPSHSPVRRRGSSVTTREGIMGPPARPASSLRKSRPNTPATARSPSPNKSTFRPPGRASPTKFTSLPSVPSPGSLYTPPRAFVKGGSARFARSVQGSSRLTSNNASQLGGQSDSSKVPSYASKTMRIKSSGRSGSHASGANDGKVALDSIFKEPSKTSTTPGLRSSVSSTSLLRPRSHGENTIASSPTSPSSSENNIRGATRQGNSNSNNSKSSTLAAKSSAALRETIAKAKAAKKAVASSQAAVSAGDTIVLTSAGPEHWLSEPLFPGESNKNALRKRLQRAVSSGSLNLAAMAFESFPEEILTMYETSTGSVGWSEMVDLAKLNMGDNKISIIEEHIFPDWSVDEMYADDEKTNQFAGLELLDFRNNLLQTIPIGLRKMERLTTLNLSGNEIGNEMLDIVWQIPQLRNLYLANNNLTGSLDGSSIATEQLRVLDVSNNKIEQFDLARGQLSTLQVLNISSNKLETLPWDSLASCELIELLASANDIGGTAFEDTQTCFDNLRELDLSRNSIVALASISSEFSTMHTVRMNGNRLKALPDMSKWQNLSTLQLSENKLTETSAIWILSALKTADFSQNDLKIIDPRIANMDTLTSLELGGNPLRDRKYLSMSTADVKLDLEKRLFAGQSDVGGGPRAQSQLDSHVFKAKNGVLDLSSSNLNSIDPNTVDFTSSSTAIHTLRLQNNDLITLPMELLCHPALKGSLRSLDISHNPRLHSTEYMTGEVLLPALQSLYVISTGLTSLDALTTNLKAPELLEVNISCHRLAGPLPCIRAWYPKVTTLLASDNWFSSVDVEAVKHLEVLDIRNNQIEGLPPALGLLGNHMGQREAGRLRSFESGGNLFRVPRLAVVDRGTEAVLKDLRRMVPASAVPEEWKEEI